MHIIYQRGKAGISMKERIIILITLIVLTFSIPPVREILTVFSPAETNKTLVIDAGHGGFDGGAVGASGITEQDINLSISQMVYQLSYFFGQKAVMTRTDTNALNYNANLSISQNKINDIHAREDITNSTENPIFMSIHLNKFEQSKYFGAQVFYSKNNSDSKIFAENMQSNLVLGIKNDNIRTAKQAANTIYLMKMLKCPAIVVECGFLSNPKEEQLLCSEDYQKQLAICIYSGYENYLNGENNETKNTFSMQ